MSLINPLAREVSAKVVYYGPGLSGKTTSLKHIYEAVRPERRGQLLTLATEGDRTLFFDFLPLQVNPVQGMGVRFQLYTVPGQVFYGATRRLVLNGADGVVFVADSQRAARDSNLHSFENLRENLDEMGIDLEKFPIVFQYNKRDLPDLLPVESLGATPETAIAGPPRLGGGGIVAELQRIAEITDDDEPVASTLEITAPRTNLPPPIVSPDVGLTFTALWEGADVTAIAEIEGAIREGAHKRALEGAAGALASLLESLPGTLAHESPMAKAGLLGLDGREYLRFSRLVSLPESAVTDKDALFALYMLISAKLKAQSI